MTWVGSMPGLAEAGPALLHLQLWSGSNLNQTFDVIMAPNVPSVYDDAYTSHDSRVFELAEQCQKTRNEMWAMLSCTLEQGWVQLASIPRWPSGNAVSRTQPELCTEFFVSVNDCCINPVRVMCSAQGRDGMCVCLTGWTGDWCLSLAAWNGRNGEKSAISWDGRCSQVCACWGAENCSPHKQLVHWWTEVSFPGSVGHIPLWCGWYLLSS